MSRGLRSSDHTLLALFGDPDCRSIVEYLLRRPATQRELRAQLGLQSGSLSRQMRALEDAALVVRERSHGPYELTLPDRTRAVLLAAADLASDLSAAQSQVDADRARSLRKGALRVSTFAEHIEGA